MRDNNEYRLDLIHEISFDSTDMADFSKLTTPRGVYRLSAPDIARLPEDTKDIDALRRRLSELLHERFQDNYAKLEAECDIKRDTFQKVLRFRNGRNVTYPLLAKFCVGAKLSIDEAEELFALMGHELSRRNRLDYILLCELNCGGDILDYDKDMQEHCKISIFSSADMLS